MSKLYRALQVLLRPFYKLFFRMRVVGLENELAEGPCLICANHISMHDILFIAVNLKRQIFFFAKKELFRVPILRWLLRKVGTISVNRGTVDLKSIQSSIQVLNEGKYVGIFPQGTRRPNVDPRTTEVKSGVGLMAYRAKSNVLPIYVQTKNQKIKFFRQVTVIIGKPILYEELGFENGGMKEYDAASKLIFERICALDGTLPEGTSL